MSIRTKLLARVIVLSLFSFGASADEFGNFGTLAPHTPSSGGGGTACSSTPTGQMDYSNPCNLITYFTVFK